MKLSPASDDWCTMSSNAAAALIPPTSPPSSPRDAESAVRSAEMQLLGALIQTGPNDHPMRVNLALGALPFLDQAQAIADALPAADSTPAIHARIASTRARVYDTGRRILEDAGTFDHDAPPEAWQECAAQALRWRRRVTEVAPLLPTGWLDLGIALQASFSEDAEGVFEEAVKLDPSGPVGQAAARYLDGSIARGLMDSIPGLPRPPPPREVEATPAPASTTPSAPQPVAEDPRTDRRRRKYLGSIELLAATESVTRSHLEKLRAAATSAPDSPEVARAIAESWSRRGAELQAKKDFDGAGEAFLEARSICPTLEGIEELVIAVDKERATRADRKVRLLAMILGSALAIAVVVWEYLHYVPKD
jgi:tetratricopeptide (TPR) repeat protein